MLSDLTFPEDRESGKDQNHILTFIHPPPGYLVAVMLNNPTLLGMSKLPLLPHPRMLSSSDGACSMVGLQALKRLGPKILPRQHQQLHLCQHQHLPTGRSWKTLYLPSHLPPKVRRCPAWLPHFLPRTAITSPRSIPYSKFIFNAFDLQSSPFLEVGYG